MTKFLTLDSNGQQVLSPDLVASAGSSISGSNTGDQNTFTSVTVAGQTTVTAGSTNTSLTLVAGTNITLTTNNTTKAVTIAASGGGGSPGGSSGQLQYNNAGAFAGAPITIASDGAISTALPVASGTSAGAGIQLTGGQGGPTNGNGGALAFQAGPAQGTGTGGAVQITGGASGGTAGSVPGGAVTIQGGLAQDSGVGGATSIYGGNTWFGTSGSVTISSGTVLSSGATGTVQIKTANAATAGAAGNITIQSGNSAGTSNGSGITLQAGNAGGTSGTGGGVSLTAGGGASSSAGGTVTISGGAAGSTGAGGAISIQSGMGGSTSGNGGAVTVQSGTAWNGTSGTTTITTGNTLTTGSSGAVQINTGAPASGSAGNITIQPGLSTGANPGGSVNINGSRGGATGSGGMVNITSGAGGSTSGASGAVTISSGTTTSGATGIVQIKTSNATGTQAAGAIQILAGTSNATPSAITINGSNAGAVASVAGGGITIQGGIGSTTTTGGAGGMINLTAGTGGLAAAGGDLSLNGGQGGATGVGGQVVIRSGFGGTTSGSSGNVNIATQSVTTTSTASGQVLISTGNSTSGNSGSITINTGSAAGGTVGSINLQANASTKLAVSTNGVALTGKATVNAVSVGPIGQCVLRYIGTTSIRLDPVDGNGLQIAGSVCVIPDAGVTLSSTGLTAGTLYYIYATQSGGTVNALEASTTAYATDTTAGNKGVKIKSGDATRTLVGMVHCKTAATFADSVRQRFVRSWFNDPGVTVAGIASSNFTAPVTWAELAAADTRCELLSWANEQLNVAASVSGADSGAAAIQFYCGLNVDTTTGPVGRLGLGQCAGVSYATHASAAWNGTVTEGYHYIALLGGYANSAVSPVLYGGYCGLTGTTVRNH